MVAKPTTYLNWTDGDPAKIAQPPPAQLLSGWTEGEPPPFEYMNWLFYEADQWIQYLDQNQNLGQPSSATQQNSRLINGGNWSFIQSTGVLAWSAAFQIAVPSLPDTANQVAAGSATLADGQVAYVTANIPFSTTGNSTNGSNTLTNLAYQQGIVVGQTVTGTGIPNGTTVSSISGSSVTLNNAATATGTGVVFTFAMTSTPTVQVANSATLVPASNMIIIARRVGGIIYLGVNTGQMVLRDGESRPLLYNGYIYTTTRPAGVAIAAGQAVYTSQGAADGGRTQSSIYPVDITNPMRINMTGIAVQAGNPGDNVLVVGIGTVNGFTGLTIGAQYYVGSTPGSLTTNPPTAQGQYIVSACKAISATGMKLNPAAGAQATLPVYSVDTYGVTTEAQLIAAVNACTTAGGGTIALMAPFTLNTAITIPPQTTLEGSKNASLLTLTQSITMGDDAMMRDVTMAGSVNMVLMPNIGAKLFTCKFIIPASATAACVTMSGTGNRANDCYFTQVVGSTTAVGISYAGGSDNRDNDCIFI